MKLLLRRHGDGLGDWLFMLQAIKHVNDQHPDVEIYVDFKLKPIGRRERFLPPIIREAFKASDTRWLDAETLFSHGVNVPVVQISHLIYPKHSTQPYVEGMLAMIAGAIERPLRFRPEFVPTFIYPEWVDRPKGRAYVALVSQGKPDTRHKDWGLENFELLGQLLSVTTPVVQVGLPAEYELTGFAPLDRRGVPFETLCGILAGARAFVGIENGLAVLALMLGTPTVVVYQHEAPMQRIRADRLLVPLLQPKPEEVLHELAGIVHAAH